MFAYYDAKSNYYHNTKLKFSKLRQYDLSTIDHLSKKYTDLGK